MKSMHSSSRLCNVIRPYKARLLAPGRCFSCHTAWSADVKHATPNVLELLSARGYIKDVAGDRNILSKVLSQRPVGFYAGIDPTAPSLHLGHLLPLMVLFWAYIHGHNTVSLIGSATAQIGDPSGRLVSRAETKQDIHRINAENLTRQVDTLWTRVAEYSTRHGYKPTSYGKTMLLDNRDWLFRLNIVEFLLSLGSSMRIGAMLGRDTVKNKMEKGDGMSFAEFTYPLLQGWDWWHMFQSVGVQIQVGGSDQFGNIVAGLDAVKAIAQSSIADRTVQWATSNGSIRDEFAPMGLTTPLLTTAAGEKFGKSAGNAVWLDPGMTSPFDLYGFLLRTADADVEKYLKLFTFVPLDDISSIMDQHIVNPGARIAQHMLASEVLELVHGREEAEKTRASHSVLRGSARSSDISGSATDSSLSALAHAEKVILPRSLMLSATFPQLLYHAGFVSTRSEGSRLVQSGGAYVALSNNLDSSGTAFDFVPVKDHQPEDCASLTSANMLIIRMGKWKIRVIEGLDDSEFERRGLDAPGWDKWKAANKQSS